MLTYDYSLNLSTREKIDVLEINIHDFKNMLIDPNVKGHINSVMSLCTKVPKSVIEDAKSGYSKPLERLLKSAPIGALTKMNETCSNINDCIMADKKKCNTRFIKFPECWEYSKELVDANNLITTIVMAWKDNKYVIITCD